MDQPVLGAGAARMDRLLQSVENEVRRGRGADLPAVSERLSLTINNGVDAPYRP
jgi:hypothetical protein